MNGAGQLCMGWDVMFDDGKTKGFDPKDLEPIAEEEKKEVDGEKKAVDAAATPGVVPMKKKKIVLLNPFAKKKKPVVLNGKPPKPFEKKKLAPNPFAREVVEPDWVAQLEIDETTNGTATNGTATPAGEKGPAPIKKPLPSLKTTLGAPPQAASQASVAAKASFGPASFNPRFGGMGPGARGPPPGARFGGPMGPRGFGGPPRFGGGPRFGGPPHGFRPMGGPPPGFRGGFRGGPPPGFRGGPPPGFRGPPPGFRGGPPRFGMRGPMR